MFFVRFDFVDGPLRITTSREGLFYVGLLLSLVFRLGYDDGPECISNWSPYGEYCYYVNNQVAYTYEQARVNCLNEYATLTSVLSTEEQAFHKELIATYYVELWIGLNDIETGDTWIWEDGSNYSFSAWNPGEPNGGDTENCTHLFPSGTWNDKPCTATIGYICKRPKGK
ncbi:C-type lectin mannose-binding isoform-like [Amphiura filiformis]|uniref:C-type lectin mannose-binding isoform-like n=1 Tax=Amphiura filiformis TaxID=82378 RepID=UPI003B2243D8